MPLCTGQTAIDDPFPALASQDRRRSSSALKEHPPQGEVPVPGVIHGGERTLALLRKRFHHDHLPLLETLEAVARNREDDVVGRGPNFDDVRPV